MERLTHIDFLRGLAALMVMLMHSSASTLPGIKLLPFYDIFYYGNFGVHIFFVISGYIISLSLFTTNYSIKNLFQFFLKRIIRINPPAYFILITFLCVELFVWIYSGKHLIFANPFDIKLIISNFLLLAKTLNTNWYVGTFWTLEIEMQFYILIALLFPLLKSTISWIRYSVLITILLIGFLNLPLAISDSIACFVLGISLFLFQKQLLSMVAFTLFTFMAALLFIYKEQYSELIFSVFSFAIILINKPINSRVFQFLGKISYSLYIVHYFLFIFFDAVLNKLGLSYFNENYVLKFGLMLLYNSLSLIASFYFHKYIEIPFINRSKRIYWS